MDVLKFWLFSLLKSVPPSHWSRLRQNYMNFSKKKNHLFACKSLGMKSTRLGRPVVSDQYNQFMIGFKPHKMHGCQQKVKCIKMRLYSGKFVACSLSCKTALVMKWNMYFELSPLSNANHQDDGNYFFFRIFVSFSNLVAPINLYSILNSSFRWKSLEFWSQS
jgi:hypothetical protein